MKNFDYQSLICGVLITALGCLGLWLILARGCEDERATYTMLDGSRKLLSMMKMLLVEVVVYLWFQHQWAELIFVRGVIVEYLETEQRWIMMN